MMDYDRLLRDLYEERRKIDRAIQAVESYALDQNGQTPKPRGPGRPPGSKNKDKLAAAASNEKPAS